MGKKNKKKKAKEEEEEEETEEETYEEYVSKLRFREGNILNSSKLAITIN